jgi:hypothetical protein
VFHSRALPSGPELVTFPRLTAQSEEYRVVFHSRMQPFAIKTVTFGDLTAQQ